MARPMRSMPESVPECLSIQFMEFVSSRRGPKTVWWYPKARTLTHSSGMGHGHRACRAHQRRSKPPSFSRAPPVAIKVESLNRPEACGHCTSARSPGTRGVTDNVRGPQRRFLIVFFESSQSSSSKVQIALAIVVGQGQRPRGEKRRGEIYTPNKTQERPGLLTAWTSIDGSETRLRRRARVIELPQGSQDRKRFIISWGVPPTNEPSGL